MEFENWLVQYQTPLRLGFFLGLFALIALWEWIKPRRQQNARRVSRWANNLGLVVVATLLVRLVVPMGLAVIAFQVQAAGWGLFNHLTLSLWLEIVLALVLLDLAIYWQHRMFHQVPVLWRLHRVHHSDLAFDVSTAVRFHPLEILLSIFIKGLLVLMLGIPATAIIIFEVILNGVALFNHGNIRLPKGLDGVLRSVLVTPDMHRVHHSDIPSETNSNYGFNLSIWDKIFGSHTPQPQKGHQGINIGLKEYSSQQQSNDFMALLKMPFMGTNKPGRS